MSGKQLENYRECVIVTQIQSEYRQYTIIRPEKDFCRWAWYYNYKKIKERKQEQKFKVWNEIKRK